MSTKDLIQKIEEIFIQKLQQKTGGGRNEIINLYKDAVIEAVLEPAEAITLK